jgi:hypothetical protein
MGFVCDSLIKLGCYFAIYYTDFCWFKAGCGKTVLMYETQLALRNLIVDLYSKQILGHML